MIEEFKKKFTKAWKANPLMPAKDRQRMALETAIGKNETLRMAWQRLRETQPGKEGQAPDREMLRLGRQMAGFIGRVTRTEQQKTAKAVRPPRNGAYPVEKPRHACVVVKKEQAEALSKAKEIELAFYLRRSCEAGFTPHEQWWARVWAVDHGFVRELFDRMKNEGWRFKLKTVFYTTDFDKRQAEVARLEKRIEALREELEGLKNG